MSEERMIINTWDQLKAAVEDALIPVKHSLMISVDRNGVILIGSPFFDTDPKSVWYHYKKKVFFGTGRGVACRKDGIAQAMAWAAERYGYNGPWVGNAMHDKIPAIVNKTYPIKRRK